MLVIARKLNERIRIDGPCEITVCRIGARIVTIGIDAETSVNVVRSEIAGRERRDAGGTDGDPSSQG